MNRADRQARRVVDLFEDGAVALEGGDVATAVQAAQRGQGVSRQWAQTMSGFGLKGCAQAIAGFDTSP